MATPVSALDVLDLAGTVAPPSGVGRYVSIGGVPYYLAPLSTNPTALGSGGSGTVYTDATMTGNGSSGSPLHVVTQFGADTTIQQLNSASALKTTWEGISAYTSNTSGAEASNYTIKLLLAGAQVAAQVIGPNGTQFPPGSPTTPSVGFQNLTGTGIYCDGTNMQFVNQGIVVAQMNHFNTSVGALFIGGFSGPLINLGQSADTQVSNLVLTGLQNSTTTDVVAGANGALATTATGGFLQIPTCPGTPTGTAHLNTGKAALVFNSSANKLAASFTAGTWVQTAAMT